MPPPPRLPHPRPQDRRLGHQADAQDARHDVRGVRGLEGDQPRQRRRPLHRAWPLPCATSRAGRGGLAAQGRDHPRAGRAVRQRVQLRPRGRQASPEPGRRGPGAAVAEGPGAARTFDAFFADSGSCVASGSARPHALHAPDGLGPAPAARPARAASARRRRGRRGQRTSVQTARPSSRTSTLSSARRPSTPTLPGCARFSDTPASCTISVQHHRHQVARVARGPPGGRGAASGHPAYHTLADDGPRERRERKTAAWVGRELGRLGRGDSRNKV